MRIEKARREHIDALARLESLCFSEPWPRDMIGRLLDRFTVAVMPDGAIAGYLVLSTVLDEGSIDNVAVSPALRRQGAADALLRDAVARARGAGVTRLSLEVREHNAPALCLYRKHGFQAAGRRKNYYRAPQEDAIIMTKVL